MSKNKVNWINATTLIFCIVSIVTMFYPILRWKLNKKLRKQVREMLPGFRAVPVHYGRLTDYANYFSNFQAEGFLSQAKQLSAKLPFNVGNIGLKDDELAVVTRLVQVISGLPNFRNAYNNEFVPREIDIYHAFFSGLEKYPLSLEHMAAF